MLIGEAERVYEFGPFRLEAEVRRLTRGGRVVPLTTRVLDVLLLLLRRKGEVVTKEDLLREVWADQIVEENNLTVAMSALRKALSETDGVRKYIETVPKRGYRFVARVREEGAGADLAIRAAQGGAGINSLAVLPLENEGDDADLEYLSDGITESIITIMSRLPRLRVMARSTVFQYGGRAVDPLEAGRQMGVGAVLTGRVRRQGESLAIAVELIAVTDGALLWGQQYDRRLSDVLVVHEEIAHEISDKLRLRLTSEERRRLTRRYTKNTAAYNLYIKGRFFWNKRTEESLKRAIGYFEEAIALDANYALAYAGLADCYIGHANWNVLLTADALRNAKRAALKALKIDDTLADVHASLAVIMLYSWNWSEAEKEYKRALAINPNAPAVLFKYSTHLAVTGRFDEAIEMAKRALEVDPLSFAINTQVGRVCYFARRYEQAIERLQELIEIEPEYAPARGLLGLVYVEKGMFREAVAELQTAFDLLKGDPEALALLGYAYARSGDRAQARLRLDALREMSKRRHIPAYLTAIIHIGLGDKENAFLWLEKAYEERSYMLVWMNTLPPGMDYLCSDPRFQDLLRRIDLK